MTMRLPGFPGPLADPPADLATRRLPSIVVPAPWFRIYRLGREALYFDWSDENRFNAPAGEFGILYAALSERCAFIETLGQAARNKLITLDQVSARGLARIRSRRPLNLVNLTGNNLVKLGADSRLCSGSHDVARRWSKALHDHPSSPDGLYYRARHDDDEYAVAFFDRVQGLLKSEELGCLGDREWEPLLATWLDHYGLGLL